MLMQISQLDWHGMFLHERACVTSWMGMDCVDNDCVCVYIPFNLTDLHENVQAGKPKYTGCTAAERAEWKEGEGRGGRARARARERERERERDRDRESCLLVV
jgi:hypothetical protein